jgi:hypothetical protein
MNESIGNPDQSDTSKSDELSNTQHSALPSISAGEAISPSRRAVLGGIAGTALATISAACSMGPDPAQWDEEVQLIDGRVIVVRQRRTGESLYDGHAVNAQPTKGYLKFLLPEIQTTPIEWSDKFMPLILNVHEGAVYVGGMPFIGRQFQEFKRPRSGWVVQRYNPSTKKWERIPASKTPEPIRKTNLLIDLVPPPEMKLMTMPIKVGKDFNGRNRIHPEVASLDPGRKSRFAQAIDDSDLTD